MNGISGSRRALVIVGAGASVEYGVPATSKLGELIEEGISRDAYCVSVGGVQAYEEVKAALTAFYGDAREAHFERIFHVLHELEGFHCTAGAVAKYLPVMFPFYSVKASHPQAALSAACHSVLSVIYRRISSACSSPAVSLSPLSSFLSLLETSWIPRVYTTNYDDFIGQASGNAYATGFKDTGKGYGLFSPEEFWSGWDRPGLFHIHGSVHMGFPHRSILDPIGDIGWFDSRADALECHEYTGSGLDRMDGTGIMKSPIITGLDKLGRLQQSPYSFYYAGLCKEASEADIVIVLGSGLADLHLNSWLREVRARSPHVPLVYVGFWGGDAFDLYSAFNFDCGDLEISLFHDLRVDMSNVRESEYLKNDGWTLDNKSSAAIWSKGFQAFLNNPTSFQSVLGRIGAV